MTNQTDQVATIAADYADKLRQLIRTHQLLLDPLTDDYQEWEEISAALAQPAPPVPGVDWSVIEKAVKDGIKKYQNVPGRSMTLDYYITKSVMNALAQTGEGQDR